MEIFVLLVLTAILIWGFLHSSRRYLDMIQWHKARGDRYQKELLKITRNAREMINGVADWIEIQGKKDNFKYCHYVSWLEMVRTLRRNDLLEINTMCDTIKAREKEKIERKLNEKVLSKN